MFGAVKFSYHCWLVSSTTWVERSPIDGCLQSSGASLTIGPPGTYCANICRCSGNCCLQIKRPLSSRQSLDVGYALCEIAENPRHTSNNGVSRLAKSVRHWRIAAGLTQTAVAKQSGVNRSYLSHLESGRRNPTLATLQRLAKILNVAPGYFL